MNNLPTKLITFSAIGIVLIIMISSFISFNNDVIGLGNDYEQKTQERTAFFDKMFKIIKNKTQIASKNDQSFKEVVIAQVQGQKNGEQLMWSWVQQSNPTATYGEVSKLYQELSRTVEGERNGFFENERQLADIAKRFNNKVDKFPGSFYNIFLGKERIKYVPIQSSTTQDVMKTGIDDNVNLDL